MKTKSKIKKWGKPGERGDVVQELRRWRSQFKSIDEICDLAERSERKRLTRIKALKSNRKAA